MSASHESTPLRNSIFVSYPDYLELSLSVGDTPDSNVLDQNACQQLQAVLSASHHVRHQAGRIFGRSQGEAGSGLSINLLPSLFCPMQLHTRSDRATRPLLPWRAI